MTYGLQFRKLGNEYGILCHDKNFNILDQKGEILYQEKFSQHFYFTYSDRFKYLAIYLHSSQDNVPNELKIIDLKTQKTIVSQKDDQKNDGHSCMCFKCYGEKVILLQGSKLQFFDLKGQSNSYEIKIKLQRIEDLAKKIVIVNHIFMLIQFSIFNSSNQTALIYMKNGKCCKLVQFKGYYGNINSINYFIFTSFNLQQCQLTNLQGKILRVLKKPISETPYNKKKHSIIKNKYYIFSKESYLRVDAIKGVMKQFEFSLKAFQSSLTSTQPIFSSIIEEPIDTPSENIILKASLFMFED